VTYVGRAVTPVDGLTAIAPRLRETFLRHRYDADGVLDLLGPDVHAALGRGEPVPVRRACRDVGELGTLVRLLLVHDTVDRAAVDGALGSLDVDEAIGAGLLADDGDGVRAAVDVRPLDAGHGTRWMVSDLDGSMRPVDIAPDHVLGVGHASLSLLRATVPAHGSVLDVGTGCGVQAVHALESADHVTATDITDRSLAMTRATMVLNAIGDDRVDLVRGPWFAPVEGRRFDRLVANPPFVVGPPTVTHSYRDSGLDLDGASEVMVSGAADHLVDGGIACMLASWVITGDDWRDRVASWVPDHGVDAWVVQRDVADPALYVGTWLRDAGYDPRTGRGAALADEWLDHLDRSGVHGIGFGFVFLRTTGSPTDLLAEELSHALDDPLGDEALAYLHRVAWLRDHDVLAARLAAAPDVALDRVWTPSVSPGTEPWVEVATRLVRTGGPRWSHDVDDRVAALVAGLRHDGLPVADVVELLGAARGEEIDPASVGDVIAGLVRHGVLVPA
jgi:methylase of polypeptide subunit release factors